MHDNLYHAKLRLPDDRQDSTLTHGRGWRAYRSWSNPHVTGFIVTDTLTARPVVRTFVRCNVTCRTYFASAYSIQIIVKNRYTNTILCICFNACCGVLDVDNNYNTSAISCLLSSPKSNHKPVLCLRYI